MIQDVYYRLWIFPGDEDTVISSVEVFDFTNFSYNALYTGDFGASRICSADFAVTMPTLKHIGDINERSHGEVALDTYLDGEFIRIIEPVPIINIETSQGPFSESLTLRGRSSELIYYPKVTEVYGINTMSVSNGNKHCSVTDIQQYLPGSTINLIPLNIGFTLGKVTHHVSISKTSIQHNIYLTEDSIQNA